MKIICEFSGGADSALAAIRAREKYKNARIVCLFINYGQIHAGAEKQKSYELYHKLNVGDEWREVIVENLFRTSSIITGGHKDDTAKEDISDVFLPLRNLVIGAIACSVAQQEKADVVVSGSKGLCKIYNDPYSYFDSTVPFYKLLEAVVNYCEENKSKPRFVVDPILAEGRKDKMSKEEVYRELLKYGIKYNDTWSCFNKGRQENDIWFECGECHNCKIKKEIFDKIEYETSNSSTQQL